MWQNQAVLAIHFSVLITPPHRPRPRWNYQCSLSIPTGWSIWTESFDSRLSGSYTLCRYHPTICLREQHGTSGYDAKTVPHKRAARRCRSQRQWTPHNEFCVNPTVKL